MKYVKTVKNLLILVLGLASLAAAECFAAPVEVPHEFESGTPAVAAEVNENFFALATAINDNDGNVVQLQKDLSTIQQNALDEGRKNDVFTWLIST